MYKKIKERAAIKKKRCNNKKTEARSTRKGTPTRNHEQKNKERGALETKYELAKLVVFPERLDE